MLGDRLEPENHRIHADDRDEPEDQVEDHSADEPLEFSPLAEDYQLGYGFAEDEPRAGELADGCAGRL